jgi:hypothetical protein
VLRGSSSEEEEEEEEEEENHGSTATTSLTQMIQENKRIRYQKTQKKKE